MSMAGDAGVHTGIVCEIYAKINPSSRFPGPHLTVLANTHKLYGLYFTN
jgi:hypothetical protein